MFKVGDIIVGLPSADKKYTITRCGVKCKVVRVSPWNDSIIYVRLCDDPDDFSNYEVYANHFELYSDKLYYSETENKMSRVKTNSTYKEILKCV